MSRVFIVQEPLTKQHGVVMPRINYSDVTPYGEVKHIFQWGEFKDGIYNEAEIVWRLRAVLHDFGDGDYILPLGNPALIGMAIAIASECNDGFVRILDWIRDDSRYRVISMDLNCQPVR